MGKLRSDYGARSSIFTPSHRLLTPSNNDESAVVTTRRCKLCLKGILHPLDGIFADGKNGKFIPATVILHLRMSIFNYGTFFTPREKWNENLGKSKLRFRNGKLTFDGSYINKRRS